MRVLIFIAAQEPVIIGLSRPCIPKNNAFHAFCVQIFIRAYTGQTLAPEKLIN